MNGVKLLVAIVAVGVLGTPAVAQTTNSMTNSTSKTASGSMSDNAMAKGMHDEDHAMSMHHGRMPGRMSMSKCEHMCQMMMKHHHQMSKHHSK